MKKYQLNLVLTQVEPLNERYALIKARPQEGPLPEMVPGQFAQLRICLLYTSPSPRDS